MVARSETVSLVLRFAVLLAHEEARVSASGCTHAGEGMFLCGGLGTGFLWIGAGLAHGAKHAAVFGRHGVCKVARVQERNENHR